MDDARLLERYKATTTSKTFIAVSIPRSSQSETIHKLEYVSLSSSCVDNKAIPYNKTNFNFLSLSHEDAGVWEVPTKLAVVASYDLKMHAI